MGEDLSRLAAHMQASKALFSQFDLQLRGEILATYNQFAVKAATETIQFLGPFFAPLTYFTISDMSLMSGQKISETCTIVLDTMMPMCASSLTHFSYNLPSSCMDLTPLPNASLNADDNHLACTSARSCHSLDMSTIIALSAFKQLTHLQMKNAIVCGWGVWDALPASLQSLDIHSTGRYLPEGLLLPNLSSLILASSTCTVLKRLLEAFPKLSHFSLHCLILPCSHQEQAWLQEFAGQQGHPVFGLNTSVHHGMHFIPTADVFADFWTIGSQKSLDHPAPWEVIAALPVTPAINTAHFDFKFFEQGHQRVDLFLYHVSRTFTHVQSMLFSNLPAVDSDLQHLYACTSLRALNVFDSSHLTGEAMLLLAAALPNLRYLCCRCPLITSNQHQTIHTLLQQRIAHDTLNGIVNR